MVVALASMAGLKSSDVAPQDLTIAPQAPWASATGTNRKPGNLVAALAAPTNGGATDPEFQVTRGGSAVLALKRHDTVATVAQLQTRGSITRLDIWGGPTASMTLSANSITFNPDGSQRASIGVVGALGVLQFSTNGWVYAGTAAPNNADGAPDSSVYMQSNGASSTLYQKRGGAYTAIGGGFSVIGTGLVKIVSNVLQSSAALLLNADVDPSAAIAPEKLSFAFAAATATPTISQATQTSDVATNNIVFAPQAPFATATTNKTPGSVIVNVALPVTGGNEASFQYQRAGTTLIFLEPFPGVPSIGRVRSPTRLDLFGSNTSITLTTGGVQLTPDGVPRMSVAVASGRCNWVVPAANNTAGLLISIGDGTAATGADITIQGQNTSGATGGGVEIKLGTGTTENGNLKYTNLKTQTTVGAGGLAAAMPTPVGYKREFINGTEYVTPYFNKA